MSTPIFNLTSKTTDLVNLYCASSGGLISPEKLVSDLAVEKTRLVQKLIFGDGISKLHVIGPGSLAQKEVEWLVYELNQVLAPENEQLIEGENQIQFNGFEVRDDGNNNWEIKIKLHSDVLHKIQKHYRTENKDRNIKNAEKQLIKLLLELKQHRHLVVRDHLLEALYIEPARDWLKLELEKEGVPFEIGGVKWIEVYDPKKEKFDLELQFNVSLKRLLKTNQVHTEEKSQNEKITSKE